MKAFLALMLLAALVPAVAADECIDAYDLMPVTQTMILCNRAYDVPGGVVIATSNITFDCNGAIIRGTGVQQGVGITLENVEGVDVKNCNLLNYETGFLLKNSNRNHVHQNNLLKDSIGVMLIQSFENVFESNSDKSLAKPVSAITSKFNTIQLLNKEIDHDFCQVNSCNRGVALDPCASDDFYCSPSCSYANDKDCPAPAQEVAPVTEYPALPDEPKSAPVPTLYGATPAAPASAPKLVSGAVTRSFMQHFAEKTQFWIIAFLSITAYLLAFLCFQHHHWKHVD